MHWRILLLVVFLLSQTGCAQSVLGVLLAPEAVVSNTAGNISRAGAETLSGLSLDQASQPDETSEEIDRIINENPNSPNAERLRNLKEQMASTSRQTGTRQQVIKEDPPPRRPMDKTVPKRKGDRISITPPAEQIAERRPPMRPLAQPSASTIEPEVRPVHTLSTYPVRIQQK
jgi:hypothetical protein